MKILMLMYCLLFGHAKVDYAPKFHGTSHYTQVGWQSVKKGDLWEVRYYADFCRRCGLVYWYEADGDSK